MSPRWLRGALSTPTGAASSPCLNFRSVPGQARRSRSSAVGREVVGRFLGMIIMERGGSARITEVRKQTTCGLPNSWDSRHGTTRESLPTLRYTVFPALAASQEKAKQAQNTALALACLPVCLPPLVLPDSGHMPVQHRRRD